MVRNRSTLHSAYKLSTALFSPGGLFKEGWFIISGSHAIRTVVASLRDERMVYEGSISSVENHITPVSEIFNHQGDDHVRDIEKGCLPLHS